ncbi:hypothetical protein Ddc_12119 [Ditylenchus destructor]|nr:hypothetical protein Ddc_12119 [Ditylenchus destructor]
MAKMLSVIITFVLLNFVLIKTESGESDNPYLVYLTIADDPLNIQVNINANPGRVTWVTSDGGLVYDSFTALHGESDKHKALAEVPSILGVSGANLTESTYFQSTEVHGIAFIQCAATIATTANIIPGTEQFEKVTEYFRETMLNELECKLQELHQRKNKPWIIIYLTHIDPDYGTQEQLTTLTLNESPSFAKRFFELITRYKIDLIASCGNFGMPEMFKQHAIDFPSDPLPKYFRVSFSGYGFGASICSENDEGENNEGGDGFFDECNYVVLDVTKHDTSFYYKKRPSGKILESGTIYKNTQEPEKCVEKEL